MAETTIAEVAAKSQPTTPTQWQRFIKWVGANPRLAAILIVVGALPWFSMCLFCLAVLARAAVIPCGR